MKMTRLEEDFCPGVFRRGRLASSLGRSRAVQGGSSVPVTVPGTSADETRAAIASTGPVYPGRCTGPARPRRVARVVDGTTTSTGRGRESTGKIT